MNSDTHIAHMEALHNRLVDLVKKSMPILEEAALAELWYDWCDHYDYDDIHLKAAQDRLLAACIARKAILAEIAAAQDELFG